FPFEEVLERAATSEQVTFVGEVTAFKEQIASSLPSATCSETLPDVVKIGRLGLKQAPASLHDFVPNYLKRVEAEENWLKDHAETTTSYIKRL
ncbi:MAG: tRNA (adenosine(37)-N6)-threonylcarbamoyltransferase complex dimerization subunit type 1 TsaB, partial [Streptococcus parasanguinis]|nr:tRNA (adenosine(37)-N6)-threonylcarbamoyltransferase complex dimerization subunit type 1 TsaB [Streptococcus parasanguinis]